MTERLTDDELAALEGLAEAATPGPWWTAAGEELTPEVSVMSEEGDLANVWGGVHHLPIQDAAYIAAANPDVVRALIADLRAAREALADLREWVEMFDPRSLDAYDERAASVAKGVRDAR